MSNLLIVDLARARMLATLHSTLEAMGMRLRLVAAHAAVHDILRAEGLEERVGQVASEPWRAKAPIGYRVRERGRIS
ncbi:MAG: hypothetical protein ACRD2L_16765, partial [Terriglobia bacterium]